MEPPKVAGVTAFQDHQYVARVTARVMPTADSKPIERKMRRILRQVFEREGIEAPVPMLLNPLALGGPAPPKPPARPAEE
jgi:small-conductance mechanosensitive channel